MVVNRSNSKARLDLGELERSLGEKVAARGILKTLLDRHPDSDVAESAKAKLKEIR